VNLRLLSWNLFHGRDHPPDPSLLTWRSRLFRVTERGAGYAQVNRPLRREFVTVLERLEWDVALLQEAPPTWHEHLRRELGADGACVLTDRNSLGRLRALVARLNPDLIASNEGGSNQTLARQPWRIEEKRVHTLTERPERRQMLWTRMRAPDGARLAIANLHGSVHSAPGAAAQVVAAAERAVEWAGELPLVFGGDLNQSPAREPRVFEELERRFGLAPPTAPDAIDHLLLRGLELVDPPRRLPDAAREFPAGDGLVLQLSDHACVASIAGMK
jgi:endonuclease/exonuclease/phosphatase family metal-dependent hydrolase